MYPPSRARNGRALPGEIGHGKDGSLCARHVTAVRADGWECVCHCHVSHARAGLSNLEGIRTLFQVHGQFEGDLTFTVAIEFLPCSLTRWPSFSAACRSKRTRKCWRITVLTLWLVHRAVCSDSFDPNRSISKTSNTSCSTNATKCLTRSVRHGFNHYSSMPFKLTLLFWPDLKGILLNNNGPDLKTKRPVDIVLWRILPKAGNYSL